MIDGVLHLDGLGRPVLPIDRSLATKLLPTVLSLVAGSVDAVSFVGLGGLFAAHITGNLVILAAHIVAGDAAPLALMISVPVFIIVLAMTRLLAAGLERLQVASLRPLLLLQFLLLASLLALCVVGGPRFDPNGTNATFAGMLGVSAMAVQNALVQISLKGAPSTAVMTTNITRFVMDLGEVLLGRSPNDGAKAGERARRTGLTIAGFVAGCSLGAGFQAVAGLWSLTLPAGLALVALAMAFAIKPDGAQAKPFIPRLPLETRPRQAGSHRASPSATASNVGRPR
ncbi:Uncharacterized membrane protein YoaK, UPF0700 family [Rhizobiales bacterium GAS191]|nr:Uncharacterized membrane protein YoaK, UPF0700 family [Rhizobiales bacterium GAS191]